jgi:hypothetical protein
VPQRWLESASIFENGRPTIATSKQHKMERGSGAGRRGPSNRERKASIAGKEPTRLKRLF